MPTSLTHAVLTRTQSKRVQAAAIIGAGLVSLAVASHMRGATAPTEQVRSARILPASQEGAHGVIAPTGASVASPSASIARFRFGFLEFEDEHAASAE
jgi:hypothetical protein